tara:strand:+ start:207 stop:407 length:201 start_codon:yes stop_codon:yes gene_type:complete
MLPDLVWQKIKEFGITNLSNRLNISRRAIYSWNDRGKIPPERIKSLMELLELDLEEISCAVWRDAS